MPANHRKSPCLIGQVFGRLTVKDFIHVGRYVEWICYCSCGAEPVFARTGTLQNGLKQSCGCLRKEMCANLKKSHGEWYQRKLAYRSYCGARSRCTDPENKNWADYGGRGIKFLFTSFEQFFAELGERPSGKTLDRVNNQGNYEIGNVRWASAKEQANNRRAHDYVTAAHKSWETRKENQKLGEIQ